MEQNNIRYNEKYKCANDFDMLLQMRDKGAYFATMEEALFKYTGKGYSGIPNTPCRSEHFDIISRWQKWESMTVKEYYCTLLSKILKTKEYHHLFSPMFLEGMYEYNCNKGTEK